VLLKAATLHLRRSHGDGLLFGRSLIGLQRLVIIVKSFRSMKICIIIVTLRCLIG
jgi:hypothetical protein